MGKIVVKLIKSSLTAFLLVAAFIFYVGPRELWAFIKGWSWFAAVLFMVGVALAAVVLISIAPMVIVQWIRGKPLDEIEKSTICIILCPPVVLFIIYIMLAYLGYWPFK